MNDQERLLKQASISQRNIRDLERILVRTEMSVMEGLIDLGVTTGYLTEAHIQAVSDSLVISQDQRGTWQS
jgi:hypothetical protein